MTIPEKQIYPRAGDRQTVYLKHVITNPNITVGDYTMYNDFINDPMSSKFCTIYTVPQRSKAISRMLYFSPSLSMNCSI